jgi:hypothetical protein
MWLVHFSVRIIEAIFLIVLFPILILWAVIWISLLMLCEGATKVVRYLREKDKKS